MLRFVAVKPVDLLKHAKSAPEKLSLEAHREAILVLRSKGYTWRDIAQFLGKRGISADHTSVYRLVAKTKEKKSSMNTTTSIAPTAIAYQKALSSIVISDQQRVMLKAHYHALNRSITYTELAKAANYEDYSVANLQYGQLGRTLGEAVGYEFDARPGEKFYSSSIGMPNSYTSGHFQLVMHHELAKAIQLLGWF